MRGMAIDFSSARAKLGRAKLHVKEAQEIYDAFIKDEPYTTRKDVDGDGWHRFVVATLKAWPPELALVLGDAVNCLRGTLDHIAFACAAGLTPAEEKAIYFPITDTKHQFKKAMERLPDRFSADARSLFEKFQPWPASTLYPNARFLAIFREVNNRDKHRAVSLISGHAKRVMWSVTPSDGTFKSDTPDGKLQVGAVLFRFKLREGVRREDVQVR